MLKKHHMHKTGNYKNLNRVIHQITFIMIFTRIYQICIIIRTLFSSPSYIGCSKTWNEENYIRRFTGRQLTNMLIDRLLKHKTEDRLLLCRYQITRFKIKRYPILTSCKTHFSNVYHSHNVKLRIFHRRFSLYHIQTSYVIFVKL